MFRHIALLLVAPAARRLAPEEIRAPAPLDPEIVIRGGHPPRRCAWRESGASARHVSTDPAPEIVARFLVRDFFSAHPGAATTDRVRDLSVRVETALRAAASAERRACAETCDRRAELWSATESRPEKPPSLRSEARSRANEAAWLADAIRARR
jgi:hypothetical protein